MYEHSHLKWPNLSPYIIKVSLLQRKINMEYLRIAKRLQENGFECYVVGGYVRDKLLGITNKDVDLCTNCTPDELEQLFKGNKISKVGKQFLVTIINDVEVATYRTDVQTEMYKAALCAPKQARSLQEDIFRRDLTVNALALDPFTDELIDFVGGDKDLKNGIIKFVGDPYERIQQDPCRILRAARFLAVLEGSFSVETLQALKDCAHHVKDIAPERIRIEILKVMKCKTPSIFFSALHLIDVLKYIFPALDECVDHTGGKYHGEDVWTHCLLACDNISPRFPILRLSALLHDIGKPETFKIAGDGSFREHESTGGRLAKKYLRKLKFSNEEILTVGNIIYAHMRVCRGLEPKGTRRLQKYLADYNVNPRDYLRLKLADRSANLLKGTNTFTPIKELIVGVGLRRVAPIPLSVKNLAISGGDIIKEFNLTPGPIIGELQKSLLEFVICEGEEVNTYDVLKVFVHDCLSV